MKFKKTISIILTALITSTPFNAGAMYSGGSGGDEQSFGGFAAYVGSGQASRSTSSAYAPPSPHSTGGSDEFTPNPTTDPFRGHKKLVVYSNSSALSTAAHPQVPEATQQQTGGTRARTSTPPGSASRPAGRQSTYAKTVRQYAAPPGSKNVSLGYDADTDDTDGKLPVHSPIPMRPTETPSLPSQESKLSSVPKAVPAKPKPKPTPEAGAIEEPKYEPPLIPAPGIICINGFTCKCVPNDYVQNLANQFCMTMTHFFDTRPYKKLTNANYKELKTEVTQIVSKINELIDKLTNFDAGPLSTELQHSHSADMHEYLMQEYMKLARKVHICDKRDISKQLRYREYHIAFGVLAQFIPAAFSFIHPHDMTIEAVSRDLEYVDGCIDPNDDPSDPPECFARDRLLKALVDHMALYYSYFLKTTDKRTFQTREPLGVNSDGYADQFYTLLYNFLKKPESLELPLFKRLIYILNIFYQQANSLKLTPETLESYY